MDRTRAGGGHRSRSLSFGGYDQRRALLAAGHDPAQLAALVSSAVFGFASIAALIRYVRQRSYLPFVLYRFGLAALVLLVLLHRG